MRRFPILALLAATLGGCAQAQPSASKAPLTLEREIALPDVSGRIDHLALDGERHRLFVAEIANGTLDAIDLDSGQRQRISGLAEPQGVAYLPGTDLLVVTCGGDGTVRFYKAATLAPVGSIKLGEDADNVRVDRLKGLIAVGYGAGAIALIDPAKRTVIRTIPLPAHPESFQVNSEKALLYVNLPNAGSLAVVDMAAGAVLARWAAPHRLNFPMALARGEGLLAIASRLPAHVMWFDAASGKIRQDLPLCGDADDLFRDDRRQRWYVSCGSGRIASFAENRSSLSPMETVASASGARTSLFSPELDRLIVAAPARWGSASARLLIYKPND